MDSTAERRYDDARRRVAAMKDFYGHLTVYAVVNAGLFAIDALSPGDWWFQWPLSGWGVAVAAHWVSVFAAPRRFGREWEQRKIEEILGGPSGRR
jgi:hypothetical protein